MGVKLVLAAAFAAAGLFAMTTSTYAEVATVIQKANIRKAPSPTAKKLGTLSAGTQVEVDPDSCTNGYCQLDNDFGPQGWVGEDFIEFEDAAPEEPEEVAEVCFYDKSNFGGASFCLEPGDVQQKLSSSWNDRISSIEITGDISVDLCSDKNLYGTCGTFASNAKSLPAKLNNKVTSIEVSEEE
jgi:hypothetical protein